MPIISLNRIERRKVTVFLSCLFLAICTWLFFALSNKYPYKIISQIHFINPPLNKAYNPLQDDTVTFAAEGTGWQLLFSRLALKPKVVSVDLKSLNTSNYITLTSQLNTINQQFEYNQKIISASPDTLFFDFSKRIMKRVSVNFLYQIGFKAAYGIANHIKLEPATVMITGAAEDLKGINYWCTDTLSMLDVSASINAKIRFKKAVQNNIEVYPKQIKVFIPVDEFTEKNLDIPLTVRNSLGREVKLVPDKVTVTLLAALGNYQKIQRDSLKASVDLNNWFKNKITQLPVKITLLPPFCKIVKTDPQTVDFLIKQ